MSSRDALLVSVTKLNHSIKHKTKKKYYLTFFKLPCTFERAELVELAKNA